MTGPVAADLERMKEWKQNLRRGVQPTQKRIFNTVAAYFLTDKSTPPPCPHCGEVLNEVNLSFVEHVINYTRQRLKVTGPGTATTEYYLDDTDFTDDDPEVEIHCPSCEGWLPDDYFDRCGFDVEWDAEEVEKPRQSAEPDGVQDVPGFGSMQL